MTPSLRTSPFCLILKERSCDFKHYLFHKCSEILYRVWRSTSKIENLYKMPGINHVVFFTLLASILREKRRKRFELTDILLPQRLTTFRQLRKHTKFKNERMLKWHVFSLTLNNTDQLLHNLDVDPFLSGWKLVAFVINNYAFCKQTKI